MTPAYLPIETSREEASTRRSRQQGLGFCQSCSFFFTIVGSGTVFVLVPLVREFFVDNGVPMEIPNTPNQVGGYGLREFFQTLLLLNREIFGVRENFREALVVCFNKSRNSLIKNGSCWVLLRSRPLLFGRNVQLSFCLALALS